VGTGLGRPDKRTDCEEALREIRRVKWVHKMRPKSLGADKGYGAGEFLHHLMEEGIAPHIPIADYRSLNERGIYRRERFQLDIEKDEVICPEGKVLKLWGIHRHSKQRVYRASVKDCGVCSKKMECTRDRARSVSYHIYEDSIDWVRQLHKTKAYRISQRMRKRIEELFGEAKAFMGFGRAKFRKVKFVKEQVLMTATAQDIKRMVKLLSRRGPVQEALAARQAMESFLSKIFFDLFARLYQNTNRTQFAIQGCW
jgi:hypothetical protein